MTKKIRAAIYIRVSTDQQAKHGDSLREQKETLESYVNNREDLELVSTYIDDGISGQKIQRDEFQRLLNDVKSDKIDIILFTKLDRWFRNLQHYLNTQEILEKNNVAWKAITQEFYDTSTPIGRTIIAQMMSFGELEAQMASERIKAVFESKTKKGEVTSGKVPLGYSIENKRLVINDEAELVRDIFSHYLTNGSMRKTVMYMEETHGIRRNYQSVKNMLTNRKYIGEHNGNTKYCPPIIEREVFEEVQKRFTNNIKTNTHRTYIFSTLIKCEVCDAAFTGGTRKYKKRIPNEDGIFEVTETKQYRCSKHRGNKYACFNGKIITEKKLEKYLLDNIKDELINTETERGKNKVKVVNKNKSESIIKKLNRLKDAYLNEVISLEEYKDDKKKLDDLLSVELQKKELEKKTHRIKSEDIDWDFMKSYSKLDELGKRELWRYIIKGITIDDNLNIKISFY